MREDKEAFKVGLFVFLTVLFLVGILIWKSQLLMNLTGMRVFIHFQNANGLLVGSDVRYRGYTVGKIIDIQQQFDLIAVKVLIKKEARLSKDSYAKILFDGIVGENYITLVPRSNNPELLKPGDIIVGETSFGIANFIDIGSQNLQELKEVIVALKETFQDDEVSGSIKGMIKNIAELSNSLNKVVAEFKTLSINSELSSTLENLNMISRKLNQGIDEDFVENTKETFENLSLITQDIYDYLNESDFKSNLSKAVKRGADLAERSDNVLEKITNIRLQPGLNYDFSTSDSNYNYHLMFDFWSEKNFLRLGIGNRSGNNELVSVQQSVLISDQLKARFGYFYNKPGIGLDYFMNRWLLELDVYDFENFYSDFAISYPLNEWLRLRGGLQYMNRDQSNFFGGVSFFR